MLLNHKHPELEERGREAAVAALRAADDAAIAEAAKAAQQVEAAMRALANAREKQRRARDALGKVATPAEMEHMGLAEIPDEEAEEEEEDEEVGCHSTHPSKQPASRTPITAGGNALKKQRVAVHGAASSSSVGRAGTSLDVD